MNSPFRSHLMQQFYSAAKNQSRPPLVFDSTFGSRAGSDELNRRQLHQTSTTSSPMLSSLDTHGLKSCHPISSSSRSFREASYEAKSASNNDAAQHDEIHHEPSKSAQSFQQMITSRRTVSNFMHHPPTLPVVDGGIQYHPILSDAIKRGVECA